MTGKWQRERPEWLNDSRAVGWVLFEDSEDPHMVCGDDPEMRKSIDDEAHDGVECVDFVSEGPAVPLSEVKWFWSEPIEVPPMPEGDEG